MQKVQRKTRRIVARIDFFAVVLEDTMIASRAKECGNGEKISREREEKIVTTTTLDHRACVCVCVCVLC